MTNDKRQIQLDNNAILTYDIVANYIGSGVLGDVYKLDDGRIAKIPRDASRLPQFDQEVAVLTHLASTGYTPQIVTGTDMTSGFPVIIMPLYATKDQYIEKLATALNTGDYVGAEKLTLTIAIAFCDAMIQLHTYKDAKGDPLFTCVDRKVIDFYLAGDKGAMILDWNVLSPYTPAFRVGEIRVFGGLLHEAYFGAKGKLPYEPFNDSRWRVRDADTIGVMSVGLRYIMARMTSTDNFYAQGNTEHFAALKADLVAWQTLIIGSPNLLSSSGIQRNLHIQKPDENNAIYEDLRVRLGVGNPEARTKALEIAHEAQKSPTEKIRGRILDALRFNVDDARKLVKSLLLDESLLSDPHVKRWDILLAYKDDGFDSRKKAEIREWLTSVGGGLHTDSQLKAEQLTIIRADYEALRQTVGNSNDKINEVDKEIKIHEQADKFNNEPSFSKQTEIIQQLVWNSQKPSYMTDDMLNGLLDGYFIHKLVDEATSLTDLNAINRQFALIQMTTRIEGKEIWLKSWLNPIRKALQFISDYDQLFSKTPISREAIVRHTSLLGQKEVLLKESRPIWDDILRKQIMLISNNYYAEAIRIIGKATEDKKVNFDELLTLKPLVNKLTLHIQSDDKVLVDKFDVCYTENQEYRKFLHEFIKTPTDDMTYPELATKLLEYLDNPRIDSRKETLIPNEKRLA